MVLREAEPALQQPGRSQERGERAEHVGEQVSAAWTVTVRRVGASCPVVIKLTKVVLQGIAFDLQNCHQYDAFNEDSCRLIFGTVIMR